MKTDYDHFKSIIEGKEMPLAFVDLDRFDENILNLLPRSGNKKIRVASKSLRCRNLLERIFKSDIRFQGIMCFSGPEAVWLSELGFDDLLIGYPCWHEAQVGAICEQVNKGKQIVCMIDSERHIHYLNILGEKFNCVIPVCMDIDMSIDLPGLHFGVWRSSIFEVEDAKKVAEKIQESKHVELVGIMGYEAQVAGVGDDLPGKAAMNFVIKLLKKRSISKIENRRKEIVELIKGMGFDLRFVNGGGTGSLESTSQEEVVTEVTVGSGFYSPALFDNYSNFKHHPAAGYAIEIVRRPKPGVYTCHGGGYIASGSPGNDKLPQVWMPEGARLFAHEGAGEVQTPIAYQGTEKLALGDPVFMRHGKAGELCERFNSLLLIANGKVVEEVPTYRGEGKCFL